MDSSAFTNSRLGAPIVFHLLPLAGCCNVSPACYAHMTHLLKGVAPVVLATEGGYNLDQTAQ